MSLFDLGTAILSNLLPSALKEEPRWIIYLVIGSAVLLIILGFKYDVIGSFGGTQQTANWIGSIKENQGVITQGDNNTINNTTVNSKFSSKQNINNLPTSMGGNGILNL